MLPFGYKLSTWLHQRLYMMPVGFFRESFRPRGGERDAFFSIAVTSSGTAAAALGSGSASNAVDCACNRRCERGHCVASGDRTRRWETAHRL